jgi:lysozyme
MVAGSDVAFAIAKATEGTGIDAQFKRNWEGIQAVGLFRGAYHYARPGSDSATQAVHFASTVGPLGFRDLPPALDLEVSDGRTAQQVLDWARAFITKAEELFGRQLLVYTGQFWKGPLGNPAIDDFFSQRALWLAGYVPAAKLVVPNTWAKWTFWQYSDGVHNDPAKIPGVPPCDQDWFDGDVAALGKLCAGDSPVPPPPPDPGPGNAWPGSYFVWPRVPAVSGLAVRAWQERIVALGYAPLDVDGVYGPQSKNACIAFQRNSGLVPDGIVGRDTWNATFAAPA